MLKKLILLILRGFVIPLIDTGFNLIVIFFTVFAVMNGGTKWWLALTAFAVFSLYMNASLANIYVLQDRHPEWFKDEDEEVCKGDRC